MDITFIFSIAILIVSVVIHEVCHGIAALSQGDATAKYEGRLTLNPLAHIDPIGSIVVPLLLYLTGTGILLGWAKPVPVNPYNFRNRRVGEFIVAFAGPLSNICIALISGLTLRFFADALPSATAQILVITTLTNLVLAIFNLVPVPPLDGSKIVFSLLPAHLEHIREGIERYGLIFSLFFVFFLWRFVSPLIYIVFGWITGIQF